MPERKHAPPRSQRDAFIAAARTAEADEDPAAFEARLKAVAKHQPPLSKIGTKPRQPK
jgi:hypothetical protein